MAKRKLSSDDEHSSTDPDTRPSFYKIMFPAELTHMEQYMREIPQDFKNHHLPNTEAYDSVTLRTACGSWDVSFAEDDEGGIHLTRGWDEFVKHHSLGESEFLVFRYDGGMSFDVMIFDKSGCKRRYQPVGPCHEASGPCFTSPFPFFRFEMKDYNLGGKSILVIPKKFAGKHFPGCVRKTITLRNSKGICWSVNIVVSAYTMLVFSRGWKDFAYDNKLSKGDICFFELVNQDMMQAHVFKPTSVYDVIV